MVETYWSMMGKVRMRVFLLLPRRAATALAPLPTVALRLSLMEAKDILVSCLSGRPNSLGPRLSRRKS